MAVNLSFLFCLLVIAINGVANGPSLTGVSAFSSTQAALLHRRASKYSFLPLRSSTSVDDELKVSQKKRAEIARKTWETVAFANTPNNIDDKVRFDDKSRVTIYDQDLFDEFRLLKGTYFVNGLSSCRIGDRVIHPFEAHGFVKCLVMDGTGESIHLKSSIVETPLTKLERKLNLPLARGVMSTLGLPLWNALTSSERNTANLSTTLWPPPGSDSEQDTILIVAGDNGMPFVVHPKTMKTIGPISMYLPELKGKKMLAHTRIDEKRQRLILCGCSFDIQNPNQPASTVVEYYEYDINFKLVSIRSYKSDRFMFVHDWMITDNYYIVPKNPAIFKWNALPRFVLGFETGTGIFEMDESADGQFILLPRHNPLLQPIECRTNNHFTTFHFGPCFESSTNNNGAFSNVVTIYASVFDRYQFGGEMGYNRGDSLQNNGMDPIGWSASGEASAPRLDKFVFDVRDQIMLERERIPILDDLAGIAMTDVPVDMPTFHGDGVECRYSYFLGAARPEGWFPFRSVVKTDLKSKKSCNWDAGDDKIASEPMFIPKQFDQNKKLLSEEDDGFVVSIVHDSTNEQCEFVIWDSKTFYNGPIGTINLGKLFPWNVHGSWVPMYVGQ